MGKEDKGYKQYQKCYCEKGKYNCDCQQSKLTYKKDINI